MIKRLKWNVLYGSDESGGEGYSSEDSENEYEKARGALAQLAKNDPSLKLPEKEDDDKFVDGEYSDGDGSDIEEEDKEEEVQEEEEPQKFIEWQECNLCPGKRFLNEREVESHLKSKDHLRNERRYEVKDTDDDESIAEVAPKRISKSERKEYRKRRLLELGIGKSSTGTANSEPVDGEVTEKSPNDVSEANKAEVGKLKKEQAAEDKKKAAAKRKLKKMKERRWKKKQEQKQKEKQKEENGEKETNTSQPISSSSSSSQKKVSTVGERSETTKKRSKKDTPSSTTKKKKKARKANNNVTHN